MDGRMRQMTDEVCPWLRPGYKIPVEREETPPGATPKAPSPARSNASSRTSELSRDSRRNRSGGLMSRYVKMISQEDLTENI